MPQHSIEDKIRITVFSSTIDHYDILRNYDIGQMPSQIKEEAIRLIGTKEWMESSQYDTMSEYMEDVSFDMFYDIATMQHKLRVIATVPRDIYSYYLFTEK